MVSSASIALVDVDVAVLTAGRLSQTAIDSRQAAQAILLALAVNGLARVCYSLITGPRAYYSRLALATLSGNRRRRRFTFRRGMNAFGGATFSSRKHRRA